MRRPSSQKTLQEFLRWIVYRRVRPRLWSWRTAARLRDLSDEDFLRIAGLPPNHDAAVAEMHGRLRQRLFFDAANRKEFFMSVLTSLQQYDDILDEADEVLENRFQTLGSGLTSLGENINWHRDFKSGTIWPVIEPEKLDLLQLGKPSDVKVPWELSRFHQVWWLGKAFWLSNGQRYADAFVSLVEDWMEKNPPGLGVNWALAMEAAIRASNWIVGYSFFSSSLTITAAFWVRFFKWLYIHGVYIEQNLEYAIVRGNHFLSNVSGLVMLGCVFRGTSFGDRWFAWGVRQLETEMGKQVYPDGVNYEKSTSYHRLVLELFYVPVLLAERNGHTFSEDFKERLHRMFAFAAAFQRPDGTVPNIGDADDGRLFRIRRKQAVPDCRHALSVGACMYDDPALRAASGGFDQEALWLIGTPGFELYRSSGSLPPDTSSTLFPEGGFAILRNTHVHVMVDIGSIGMEGWGGHGHNDTFSFEYWLDGHPVIVDPGTYAYTFDTSSRQALRGVRSHNTIMVDERELVEFAGLWSITKDTTRPRLVRWYPETDQDTLSAEHYAYTSLPDPVTHRRTFRFDRSRGKLTISDDLQGSGDHAIISSLHLHPSCIAEDTGEGAYLVRCGRRACRIELNSGNAAAGEAWYSASYGVRERTIVLRARHSGTLPMRITMSIDPVD